MPESFPRRDFLLWLAFLPLAGCTPAQIQRGLSTTERVLSGDMAGAVSRQIPVTGLGVVDQAVRRQVQTMVREIGRRWTDEKVASEREYVKYTDNYQTRAIVNFDRGLIRVETVRPQKPRATLRRAIVATLLTPEDPARVDLLSAREIPADGRPFLYRLVVDHEGEYIRWPWRAERYADYLLAHAYRREPAGDRTVHYVTFAMVRQYQQNQQFKFQQAVLENARRFNQPPPLIFAIIEAESSFNPYAMSHVPAYGLMQIVPTSAGRDAHQLLYGRAGTPTREYLFVPANNIRMGTAYLHILDRRYLRGVENRLSREYCVIAAYNTGSGNVLNAFDRGDRTRALARINRLAPQEVYRHLVRNLPYRETREYLPKVVRLQDKYRGIG